MRFFQFCCLKETTVRGAGEKNFDPPVTSRGLYKLASTVAVSLSTVFLLVQFYFCPSDKQFLPFCLLGKLNLKRFYY